MSIKYNLFKIAIKASGVKKRTSYPPEELIRLSREKQAKNPFILPEDDEGFEYSDHPHSGFHCIKVHPRGTDGNRAILYVYGGGMMMPPATRYIGYAKRMAQLTQSDVWFPRYPLCSDATILDAVRMVHDTWTEMTGAYDAGCIAFYGFSSGASILLSTLLHNAEKPTPLPRPALFVGIAPGGCPADEAEAARMRELDRSDIEVSVAFMDSMRELMAKGCDDIPDYMIDGTGGSWDNLPPTYLYYGSLEVLSAKAPAFEHRLQQAKVPHNVVIREGMCHCYCIAPLFPEAQDDYDAIIELMRQALISPNVASAVTQVSESNKAHSDVAFWDRTAFAYDLAMRKGDKGVAQAAAFCARYLKPTDIVLDAACGTAAFACAIAPRVGFVAACDLSSKMLVHARAKAEQLALGNVEFGSSDITALDFDDDTFDAAIAGNVLHLLDDPKAAIDELVRVVRPGGPIIIPNYYVDGKPADLRFVKAAETIGFPLKSDWRKEDFLAFIVSAGLDIVDERTFAGARPLCVAVTKSPRKAYSSE